MPFIDALRAYSASVQQAYTGILNAEAWPEEQLKTPVSRLIGAAAEALDVADVLVSAEVRVEDVGRPDLGVSAARLLTGYVELKRPGKGADPARYTGRDRAQWAKFKALPNVLYTDGEAFALYRNGERVGARVKLSGDPVAEGAAAVSDADAAALLETFRTFLGWAPVAPRRPKVLAEMLAPVCRMLRDDVEAALGEAGSPLVALAADWRRVFFPDATDREFADAYAQTLTYALLLARFSNADDLTTERAVAAIRPGHRLLAETLRVLGDPRAREQVDTPLDVLERILTAVDPAIFAVQGGLFGRDGEGDPWLYFYEDFLAAYDPRMRNNRGVYFTPWQVVQAQVRLTAQLLDERFDAADSFASEDVTTLDPACGTGAYILAAVRHGLDAAAARRGPGALAGAATRAAANVHAFEILVGSYAVAHLRLTQQVAAAGGQLPADGAHVYLTDTLEDPGSEARTQDAPFALRELAEEHRRAQRVKREVPVLVCIGNPPYDREQAEAGETISRRKGGWVRHGHVVTQATQSAPEVRSRPILADFTEPLAATGDGVHAKNLYNDYVYFWRWALWKVCGQGAGQDHGIVSFITASSFLRGPAFKGMRQRMREAFDEVWVLDLGGDNLGARRSENVFAIQTPVCVTTGVRHRAGDARRQAPGTPAVVRYARVEGTEAEKLAAMAGIEAFEGVEWSAVSDGWDAPLLPVQSEAFAAWPAVTDVFPWQESGMQFTRSWPIAPDRETLEQRWRGLLTAANRAGALKETRDRKVDGTYSRLDGSGKRDPAISSLPADAPMPDPTRIAFRTLDRQWALVDNRLGDYLRPTLLRSRSERQVYMTSFLTYVPGEGSLAVASTHVPDYHSFRGSFGGKHVIPLWRDAAGTEANVTVGLTDALAAGYGHAVAPEDVFAYAYAVLAAPSYVERFWEALETPGPRLPMTRDAALFAEAAALGRELLWLHTYGERFVPPGARAGTRGLPQGAALLDRATPTAPERYPERWSYSTADRTLRVGEGDDAGVVTGVAPEVMAFSVSGFVPVKSWLDYRMRGGAGRTSSPLDAVRPSSWSFDDELLDLLWVLEATLERHGAADDVLGRIVDGETFTATDLPTPTSTERKGPGGDAEQTAAPLFELLERAQLLDPWALGRDALYDSSDE